MNILIDRVPESVEIEGIEHKLNTDYRTSILFELLMQDKSITDQEKIELALDLYYPVIPEDWAQAIDHALWFYSCGKEDPEEDEDEDKKKTVADKPKKKEGSIYSFEHDDECIYSAFLDQYRIDLQDIEYLHWWKFRALFKGLKEDNLMVKIMGFRSIEINNDMSESDQKHYKKMKQIYALPDNRTLEEKENDFNDTIANLL